MSVEVVVSDLAFRYISRADWALDGVRLTVHEGEFLGITGPSGAGKTTLCLSLIGLVPSVIEGTMRGSVTIDGLDTRRTDVSRMSAIIGIVFQDPRSQLTGSAMTVEEEVAFGLQNLGVPRQVMVDRIREALDAVGLEGFEARSPFELSGGEQQRLSLATVLAMHPQVIVLDEPTEMLDPEGQVEVMRAVRRIHEKYNMTTILVSNQAEVIIEHAERIIVLQKGRIVSENTRQEYSNRAKFLESLGVRPTQVSRIAYMLDEHGFWQGDYPISEDDAAEMIRKCVLR